MTNRKILFLGLVRALLLASLCFGVQSCATGFPCCEPELALDYIRVDYSANRAEFDRIRGEVFASDIFRASSASYKTVAIRVPESCLNETAAQKTGQESNKVILNTACGAYFSELEKALVKSGYRVISWDRIQNSYDKAVELGADIVFMVNSLETSTATLGDKSQAVYNYYHADESGLAASPAPLGDNDRANFSSFVKAHTSEAARGASVRKVYTSIMDVTAITADHGETVWFYNKTVYEDPTDGQSNFKSFLFAGREGKWWPIYPEGMLVPVTDPHSDNYQSQDVDLNQVDGSDLQNRQEKRKFALIREVVSDFVEAFKAPGAAGLKSPGTGDALQSSEKGDAQQAPGKALGTAELKAPGTGDALQDSEKGDALQAPGMGVES